MVDINIDTSDHIAQAAAVIQGGGLVAFPTETVYGLGANALDETAVQRIFAAKGRPGDNPLIVHISSMMEAENVAVISDKARKLADVFWPGPLTMVLEKKDVPGAVTAGLNTVGVRMPDNDTALSLIAAAGVPIAAPSANKSGSPSPTTAAHVVSDFGDDLMVLDAGNCSVGVESTVIDMTKEIPIILRPGAVTQDMIAGEIGEVEIASSFSPEDKPASPGMKYRHYAPSAKVTVVEGDHVSVAEAIKYLYDKDMKNGETPLVMASRENRKYYGRRDFVVTGSYYKPEEAARQLYSQLREADEEGYTSIYYEALPKEGIGFAVMNRVYKASAYNIVKV